MTLKFPCSQESHGKTKHLRKMLSRMFQHTLDRNMINQIKRQRIAIGNVLLSTLSYLQLRLDVSPNVRKCPLLMPSKQASRPWPLRPRGPAQAAIGGPGTSSQTYVEHFAETAQNSRPSTSLWRPARSSLGTKYCGKLRLTDTVALIAFPFVAVQNALF